MPLPQADRFRASLDINFMDLREQKKRLREKLKNRRAELSVSDRRKMSKQISRFLHDVDEFNQARRIFCYVSYISEVETAPLLRHFLERGRLLAVPKIIDRTGMIAVAVDDLDALEPDRTGIMTPKSGRAVTGGFDIAITPGLGFTENGERLGYGRGYYDRWFANNPVTTKIGIGFELQLVDALPVEKTDMPLDILVTEQRIIKTKTGKFQA